MPWTWKAGERGLLREDHGRNRRALHPLNKIANVADVLSGELSHAAPVRKEASKDLAFAKDNNAHVDAFVCNRVGHTLDYGVVSGHVCPPLAGEVSGC
jgi:hypothetical protein